MNSTQWLMELCEVMHGEIDEEGNLIVDSGDGFVHSFSGKEIVQFHRTGMSPRECADILRMGGGM